MPGAPFGSTATGRDVGGYFQFWRQLVARTGVSYAQARLGWTNFRPSVIRLIARVSCGKCSEHGLANICGIIRPDRREGSRPWRFHLSSVALLLESRSVGGSRFSFSFP